MVKIKYSKLLKYPFLILLYTIIFSLLLLNFPKYISADSEKENNGSKAKTEYSLWETKTDDRAQDTQDKDKEDEDDKVDKEKEEDKDKDIENTLDSNEFTQRKEEEKIEDFKNLNNDLSKLNEKLVKSEEKSIHIFNLLLQKLLNNKEDKITEILDINVNSIGELLNIEKIMKNYKVIAVISFDEIIDLNYEKDIKQNKENILTEKYPEFILNFWNNFKEFAALFN